MNKTEKDFPVNAHNHETGETHVFYTLQGFIDYLNEIDDIHSFFAVEKPCGK